MATKTDILMYWRRSNELQYLDQSVIDENDTFDVIIF